jgi:hypothetical protein
MTQPWWASALSTAEVSVLIACKHLSAAHHNGIFNLEMAWDIYRQHLKRQALAADSDPLQNDPRRPALVRSQVYGRDAFELVEFPLPPFLVLLMGYPTDIYFFFVCLRVVMMNRPGNDCSGWS